MYYFGIKDRIRRLEIKPVNEASRLNDEKRNHLDDPGLFLSRLRFFFPSGRRNGFKEYNKGLTLYHKGHYEDALELFQQAIDENLEFWQAYQMSGYCHFDCGTRKTPSSLSRRVSTLTRAIPSSLKFTRI